MPMYAYKLGWEILADPVLREGPSVRQRDRESLSTGHSELCPTCKKPRRPIPMTQTGFQSISDLEQHRQDVIDHFMLTDEEIGALEIVEVYTGIEIDKVLGTIERRRGPNKKKRKYKKKRSTHD